MNITDPRRSRIGKPFLLNRCGPLSASAVILIATTSNAYGYIDPGYGSLLWQILIAGLFGTLFYARSIIFKVKNWWRTGRTRRKR